MDLHTLSHLVCPSQYLHSPALGYISVLLIHSTPPYLHNTLRSKSVDFRICISDWRACQIPQAPTSLSNTPLSEKPSTSVECSAADVRDPASYALRLSLFPYSYTTASVYPLYPLSIDYILPFVYTSE